MSNPADILGLLLRETSKLSMMYILNDYPFSCFPFQPNGRRAVTSPNETGGVFKISGWDVFKFPNIHDEEGEATGFSTIVTPKNLTKVTFPGWIWCQFTATEFLTNKNHVCEEYWSDASVK